MFKFKVKPLKKLGNTVLYFGKDVMSSKTLIELWDKLKGENPKYNAELALKELWTLK